MKIQAISTVTELGVDIDIYEHIDECATQWDAFMTDHVFLGSAYLSAVEKCPPKGLVPYYVLFKDQDGTVVGKAYFQNKTFKGSESLKITKGSNCPSFFSSIGYYLKQATSKKVEFESLACGQIMLSGNYAFRFVPKFDRPQQAKLVDCAIEKISSLLKEKGKELSIILVKDFPQEERFIEKTGIGPNFFEFQIQPAMILNIPEDWKSEEDYLQAMSSKYRVRYRRSRKKMEGLEKRELNLEDIKANKDRLYDLYKAIANNSGFNLFHLHQDYLIALKEALGPLAEVTGYFDQDVLIGFTTLILDPKHAEAHFIGFDDRYSRSHQLYQNMLYDMVVRSVENGRTSLDFARTALEIKSTVGAEPQMLYCYMRHQKSVHNTWVPKLFNFLSPEEEWVQRRPFKLSRDCTKFCV